MGNEIRELMGGRKDANIIYIVELVFECFMDYGKLFMKSISYVGASMFY